MSINQSNINALKALSRALGREADYARSMAEKLDPEDVSVERLRASAALADLFGTACNEAAEDLHQQDLDAIERMKS